MTRHVSLMEVCGKSHPGGGRTHAWRLASASLSGEVRGVTRLPEQSGRGRAAGPAIRVGGARPWGTSGPGEVFAAHSPPFCGSRSAGDLCVGCFSLPFLWHEPPNSRLCNSSDRRCQTLPGMSPVHVSMGIWRREQGPGPRALCCGAVVVGSEPLSLQTGAAGMGSAASPARERLGGLNFEFQSYIYHLIIFQICLFLFTTLYINFLKASLKVCGKRLNTWIRVDTRRNSNKLCVCKMYMSSKY